MHNAADLSFTSVVDMILFDENNYVKLPVGFKFNIIKKSTHGIEDQNPEMFFDHDYSHMSSILLNLKRYDFSLLKERRNMYSKDILNFKILYIYLHLNIFEIDNRREHVAKKSLIDDIKFKNEIHKFKPKSGEDYKIESNTPIGNVNQNIFINIESFIRDIYNEFDKYDILHIFEYLIKSNDFNNKIFIDIYNNSKEIIKIEQQKLLDITKEDYGTKFQYNTKEYKDFYKSIESRRIKSNNIIKQHVKILCELILNDFVANF